MYGQLLGDLSKKLENNSSSKLYDIPENVLKEILEKKTRKNFNETGNYYKIFRTGGVLEDFQVYLWRKEYLQEFLRVIFRQIAERILGKKYKSSKKLLQVSLKRFLNPCRIWKNTSQNRFMKC